MGLFTSDACILSIVEASSEILQEKQVTSLMESPRKGDN